MAFTSSITTNMNEYLVTCDKITLRAFFRCGVDRINNALVLQEDDRDRMLYDEVIIKRPYVRKLLMALIRRVYVNEGNLGGIYVEEIAPGLVVTPAEKTVSPGNTMSCLRICLSVDHAVLPQPPAPRVHFVHIPVIHALGLVGYMLCREQSIEHVIPLPAETPTLQFFGIRATGEFTPWDYYLNMNSAVMNEGAITILPPHGPVVIEDASGSCQCCQDETPVSIMDTDEGSSQTSPRALSREDHSSPMQDSPRSPSPDVDRSHGQEGARASEQSSPRSPSLDSPRSPSPDSPRSPSPDSPRSPSPESPRSPGLNDPRAPTQSSPQTSSPRDSSPSTPSVSPLSNPRAPSLGSSPISATISHTPRLDAMLMSRAYREQQGGPHHLEEYVRPRPSTPLVCRYMIYRAFRQKIEEFGYSPFTGAHVFEARRFLVQSQNMIRECINDTLDEAGYKLNRITKGGLAGLIAETGIGSPSANALNFLNDPNITNIEISAPELELIALYNHTLRLKL